MFIKPLAVAAAILAFVAQPATARSMTATFTGTVIDTGGPLDGKSFSAVIRYDPDLGGMNYYVGGEDSHGGDGIYPTPALYESFHVSGTSDYDLSIAPRSADIALYASSGNQFLGTQGFTGYLISFSESDDASGYYFNTQLDLRGFADTPDDLETDYSTEISRGAYGNYLYYEMYVGGVRVKYANLGLNPTSLTVVAAPVPEPGEWAMIAAGLGVAGFAARRRTAA